jgi:hypothetical protein
VTDGHFFVCIRRNLIVRFKSTQFSLGKLFPNLISRNNKRAKASELHALRIFRSIFFFLLWENYLLYGAEFPANVNWCTEDAQLLSHTIHKFNWSLVNFRNQPHLLLCPHFLPYGINCNNWRSTERPSEGNGCSDNREISNLLWNPKFQKTFHNRILFLPEITNSVQKLTFYVCETDFNVSLSPTDTSVFQSNQLDSPFPIKILYKLLITLNFTTVGSIRGIFCKRQDTAHNWLTGNDGILSHQQKSGCVHKCWNMRTTYRLQLDLLQSNITICFI